MKRIIIVRKIFDGKSIGNKFFLFCFSNTFCRTFFLTLTMLWKLQKYAFVVVNDNLSIQKSSNFSPLLTLFKRYVSKMYWLGKYIHKVPMSITSNLEKVIVIPFFFKKGLKWVETLPHVVTLSSRLSVYVYLIIKRSVHRRLSLSIPV